MNAAVRKAHEIATRAAELVGGDRDRQHGKKRQNFENIAAVWNVYLQIRKEPAAPLDGADVGHLMALMKIARTQSGALNVDDYVDGAGYLACAGEVAQDYADPVDAEAQAAVEGRQDTVRELQVGDRVRIKQSTFDEEPIWLGWFTPGKVYTISGFLSDRGYARFVESAYLAESYRLERVQ